MCSARHGASWLTVTATGFSLPFLIAGKPPPLLHRVGHSLLTALEPQSGRQRRTNRGSAQPSGRRLRASLGGQGICNIERGPMRYCIDTVTPIPLFGLTLPPSRNIVFSVTRCFCPPKPAVMTPRARAVNLVGRAEHGLRTGRQMRLSHSRHCERNSHTSAQHRSCAHDQPQLPSSAFDDAVLGKTSASFSKNSWTACSNRLSRAAQQQHTCNT